MCCPPPRPNGTPAAPCCPVLHRGDACGGGALTRTAGKATARRQAGHLGKGRGHPHLTPPGGGGTCRRTACGNRTGARPPRRQVVDRPAVAAAAAAARGSWGSRRPASDTRTGRRCPRFTQSRHLMRCRWVRGASQQKEGDEEEDGVDPGMGGRGEVNTLSRAMRRRRRRCCDASLLLINKMIGGNSGRVATV